MKKPILSFLIACCCGVSLAQDDLGTVMARCLPVESERVAFNPESWAGPDGGDPVAVGVVSATISPAWRWHRAGRDWVKDKSVSQIRGELLISVTKIQMAGTPAIVVGAHQVRCPGAGTSPVVGSIAAQWFPARRAYVYSGPRSALHAARVGSEIRITTWGFVDGALVDVTQWRVQQVRTPPWTQ